MVRFNSCPAAGTIDPNDGWLLNGFTVTVKLFVALKLGEPLSATATANKLVVPAWLTNGRQTTSAFVGFKVVSVALAGPFNKVNVNVCAGKSGSLAKFVTVKVAPALRV